VEHTTALMQLENSMLFNFMYLVNFAFLFFMLSITLYKMMCKYLTCAWKLDCQTVADL